MAYAEAPTSRKCLHCNYWGGPRKIRPGNQTVEFAGNDVKGPCNIGLGKGPFGGRDNKASGTCNKFV